MLPEYPLWFWTVLIGIVILIARCLGEGYFTKKRLAKKFNRLTGLNLRKSDRIVREALTREFVGCLENLKWVNSRMDSPWERSNRVETQKDLDALYELLGEIREIAHSYGYKGVEEKAIRQVNQPEPDPYAFNPNRRLAAGKHFLGRWDI